MSQDRRRSPRVEILGRLHGQLVSIHAPVVIREMSVGGLSLESTFPLPDSAVHEFRVTLGDDSFVLLRGRVLRSSVTEGPDGAPVFVSGIQFVDEDTADEPAVAGGLIERLA